MNELTGRAPARIDFGGGWTDVPPYSDERGGCVCCAAIDLHAIATVVKDAEASVAGHHEEAEMARAALVRRPPWHAHHGPRTLDGPGTRNEGPRT
jgi:D-glycero-alpha-D-manno-heptose-7-phosphate kinase